MAIMVILRAIITMITDITTVTGTMVIMVQAMDPGIGDELNRQGAREGHII
jgi:hypothetical protein